MASHLLTILSCVINKCDSHQHAQYMKSLSLCLSGIGHEDCGLKLGYII